MEEIIKIELPRYRTDKDEPTCAYNVQNNDHCPCLMVDKKFTLLGCAMIDGLIPHRRRDAEGYTIPFLGCPFWDEQELEREWEKWVDRVEKG